MSAPAFSVIIPCYNLGRFVDEAVESVLAQTFQDLEIVIVNDGSTDPFTNELLASYTRPRTRVLSTPNRGVMAARNLGIRESTGRYISALDADDRLRPAYFEKAFAILESDETIAWVSCWVQLFGEESWEWKPERCDLVTLLGEQTVCTAAPVRRTAVAAIGGYDERMPKLGFEDWEFWINMAVHGYQGVILPEVLFDYRARADSLSKKAWFGEYHGELFRFMLEKHRASYQQFALELLSRREATSCEVLAESYAMERRIDSWLTPAIARKEDELARLESTLASRSSASAEPKAASWKQWRIVAPLRAVDRLRRRLQAKVSRS